MTDPTRQARLRAEDLTLAYDGRTISEHLDVTIPEGSFTVILGPNACGKSTLLKAFARVLAPAAGSVLLTERPVARMAAKAFARELALLPQSLLVPEGIKVKDLVGRGRFPHQTFWRQWSTEDEQAVAAAMEQTHVSDLGARFVSELSGGQRQRVWLAMVLAQQTPTVLLDEPTTFLDIAHQYEVMEICAELNRSGRTVVAVLHDLNQAARYADHLIVMRAGDVVAQGPPAEVLTEDLVHDVYGLANRVVPCPETGAPMAVPAAQPLGARTVPSG